MSIARSTRWIWGGLAFALLLASSVGSNADSGKTSKSKHNVAPSEQALPASRPTGLPASVEDVVTVNTKKLHKGSEIADVSASGDVLRLAQDQAATTAVAPVMDGSVDTSPVAQDEVVVADASSPDYRIGASDVLDFRSFDDESLSTQASVRYDGYVSLPLVPDVKVMNMTRAEATEAVKNTYKEIFVEPHVSLVIRQSLSKTIYIIGDVSAPREYPYTKPISLLGAITQAGGLRINQLRGDSFVGAQGQIAKAFVIRHPEATADGNPGRREVLEFDMRNISKQGEHPSDTPVYAGDVVYVPEGVNLVYLIGEVRSPGVFQLAEGMSLLQLLARGGGPNFSTAQLKKIVLMREVDEMNTDVMLVNVREILRTGEDMALKPGDIIYIPRKGLIRLQEIMQRFAGSVSPILNLYTQAWDSTISDDRVRQFLDGNQAAQQTDLLTLLRQIQTFIPSGGFSTTP